MSPRNELILSSENFLYYINYCNITYSFLYNIIYMKCILDVVPRPLPIGAEIDDEPDVSSRPRTTLLARRLVILSNLQNALYLTHFNTLYNAGNH